VLLVGKRPRFFLPGAYVQYLEFAGTSLAELPIDQAEVVTGGLKTAYSRCRQSTGRAEHVGATLVL
jgi:hypothetical protein